MATKNVTPLRACEPASPRVDGPLQQRVNLLIAQVGVLAAAASTIIEGIDTERERQYAACAPLILDSVREELEHLAGDLETLERGAPR